MRCHTGACSEQGDREHQQDAYACLQAEDKLLLVVADGNGGEGGKKLAQVAVKTVVAELCFELSQGNHKRIEAADHLLEIGMTTLMAVAKRVRTVKELHEFPKAGTTITLTIVTPLFVGNWWIGDSPCYVFQPNELKKLTHPVHTLAEALIASGESRESISRQPSLNSVLTRCVGHPNAEPDGKVIRLTTPSLLLVGSDGVFGYVSEATLVEFIEPLLASCFEPQDLAEELVRLALANGSDDNCTLVVALCLPDVKPRHTVHRLTRLLELTS